MADQLATSADLNLAIDPSGATTIPSATATMLLELATAKVQRAAGGQRIVDLTDTAVIDVDPWDNDVYLPLPQLPVRSVSLVVLDGSTITDWVLRKQMLWRANGWMTSLAQPSQVKVTSAHGYVTGSQWLQLAREMTLSLAVMPYSNPSRALSESIDDYHISYGEADARMQLTEFQVGAIQAAYGTSAYVTLSRE